MLTQFTFQSPGRGHMMYETLFLQPSQVKTCQNFSDFELQTTFVLSYQFHFLPKDDQELFWGLLSLNMVTE